MLSKTVHNDPDQSLGDRFATLGGRLRAARLARGYTHDDLKERVNVTRNTISMWETGAIRNPDPEKLAKIARMLRVRLKWLTQRAKPDPKLPSVEPRQKMRTSMFADDHIEAPQQVFELNSDPLEHSRGWHISPHALWAIPHDVLDRNFRSLPGKSIVVRSWFDLSPISSADFLIIDTSGTEFDRPGIYLIVEAKGGAVQPINIDRSLGGNSGAHRGKSKRSTILGRVAAYIRGI